MKQKLLRHKNTNKVFIATPELEKMAHMIPLRKDEVEFDSKTGWRYVPPEKGLAYESEEEPEEEVGDTPLYVVDRPVSHMSVPELQDLTEKINQAFPELKIDLGEDAKKPELVKAVSAALKKIREVAENEQGSNAVA